MKAPLDLQETFRREVEEEMRRRGTASPVEDWMDQHHAQAAEILSQAHADWTVVAEAFGSFGLKDHLGGRPTAETAREAWQRVEARRRAGMALRKGK